MRGVDWDRNVASARAKLRDDMSDAELFALLVSLLRPLQDSHVTLQDPKAKERYFEEGQGRTLTRYYSDPKSPGYPSWAKMRSAFMESWVQSVETDLLRGKGRKAANGKLLYGFVEPGIAYLAATELYNTFEGVDWREDNRLYSKALDEAFTSFAGATALIIDLSNNRGGSPTKGRDIVSRVAPHYTMGGSFKPARPAGLKPQPWDVSPATARPRFNGPVYVVTSDITVSSGEFALILLRELPNVRVVGERTRGSLSNLFNKVLPNGWIMEMPNQSVITSRGEAYAGVGIPPETPLPIFGSGQANAFATHRSAIRAISDRAKQYPQSRKPCW